MQTENKCDGQCANEDALVAIGDIAISGKRLQAVLATGIASNRLADACEGLFTEIAELAAAGEPANDGNGA